MVLWLDSGEIPHCKATEGPDLGSGLQPVVLSRAGTKDTPLDKGVGGMGGTPDLSTGVFSGSVRLHSGLHCPGR